MGGSTRIPKVREVLSDYFGGKPLNHEVDPDEAVAHGATVQAAILLGQVDDEITDIVLVDVTPLSLGVETVGGCMSVIVPRNSQVPVKKEKNYTTNYDNQTSLDFTVYQGERQLTKDNHKLGFFKIAGIKKEKEGVPRVTVQLQIDSNGVLHLTAIDQKNTSN